MSFLREEDQINGNKFPQILSYFFWVGNSAKQEASIRLRRAREVRGMPVLTALPYFLHIILLEYSGAQPLNVTSGGIDKLALPAFFHDTSRKAI